MGQMNDIDRYPTESCRKRAEARRQIDRTCPPDVRRNCRALRLSESLAVAGHRRLLAWRTVRRVRPAGSLPILDVCTGTGDLALAYDRAAGRKLGIVGADFCHPMLVIGRQKVGEAGSAAANHVCRGRRPIAAVSRRTQFQIVSVAFGLRNVTDTDRGLGEMLRVCRPGGRIAVLEFSMPRWQPFKAIYRWYFRHVLPRIGQALARNPADAYNYLPESVGEFPQGEALAERMRAAGLADVRYYPLTLGVATLYVGKMNSSTCSQGSPTSLLAITGASGAIYAVRLLEVLLRDGRDVHLSISPSGRACSSKSWASTSICDDIRCIESLLPATQCRPSGEDRVLSTTRT